MHYWPRLEGVEVRLQESSEAFERSREVAKKSKMEYEKVKKQRCVYSTVESVHCNISGICVPDMTGSKMPLNMCQPSLMTYTRYR